LHAHGRSLRGHAILAIGAASGAINGWIVSYLGVQPFMVTFATWAILDGFALFVLPTPGGAVPGQFTSIFVDKILGVPAPYWMLSVLLILWNVVRTSRFGLHLRATGGDEQRAALNGLDVRRVRFLAYVLSGLLSSAAGVYLAAVTSGGDPTLGDSYILASITAVVVGGTVLSGGRGGAGLTVLGALILAALTDIVTAVNLTPNWAIVASSVLLLGMVGLRQFIGRRRRVSL
jgi:ribose transport system permease protein